MSTEVTREVAAAREEVLKCEKEIQDVKNAMRKLAMQEDGNKNSLQMVCVKVGSYSMNVLIS